MVLILTQIKFQTGLSKTQFAQLGKFKPKMCYTGNSSLKIGMDNFKFGMNNPMDIGYDLGPLQSIGGYN